MADITLSTTAYCKLLLHAAKYPQRAINGVLLAEKARSKDSKGLKVVDAIPLFHLTLGLAPMMEVALMQVCQTGVTVKPEIVLKMQTNRNSSRNMLICKETIYIFGILLFRHASRIFFSNFTQTFTSTIGVHCTIRCVHQFTRLYISLARDKKIVIRVLSMKMYTKLTRFCR